MTLDLVWIEGGTCGSSSGGGGGGVGNVLYIVKCIVVLQFMLDVCYVM